LAIGGMVFATIAPSSGNLLLLPMCLGGLGSAPLPEKGDGGPAKCPGACHAMCCRSRNEIHRDDSDQDT
jgi:hypothetical protein